MGGESETSEGPPGPLVVETVDDGGREEDDINKVFGNLPMASGSRPVFIAAVGLKLFALCEKLATTLGEGGVEITYRNVDEGPLGNGNPSWDVERVSDLRA